MDDNLNSLFVALRKYFDYFRAYSGMPFPMPNGSSMLNATPMISEEELVGLITWLQLATALAKKVPFTQMCFSLLYTLFRIPRLGDIFMKNGVGIALKTSLVCLLVPFRWCSRVICINSWHLWQ